MHWKTKSAAFGILSKMPFGGTLHHWLQRHVTHEWPRSDAVLDELIVAARDIIDAAGVQASINGTRFLEIGAGRDLAVALALRMMGVGGVTAIDIDRLAQLDLVNHSAQYMALRLGVDVPVFGSFDALCAFGIDYRAPLQMDDVDDFGYDCFYSVDTLEHIPAAILPSVLSAGRSRLKSDGITVHIIDYSDHYARGTGASRLNFLRYSDRGWAAYNSRFLFMNRLRHSEYMTLFAQSGYHDIIDTPFHLDDTDVPVVDFDRRFRVMPMADLTALRALISGRP